MTYQITVTGLVQGIGFRPFVAELAEKLKLSGQVKNLGGIVEILVSGEKKAVEEFIQRLRLLGETGELPGCRIDECVVNVLKNAECEKVEALCEKRITDRTQGTPQFNIVESGNIREKRRFLPVDLPTCDRCVAEMHDPSNRRYRYPFISCTACGPRFSIQKKVPYDRATITMDVFPMCEACEKEYTQKGNIRRHAQTIACETCGPTLNYLEKNDELNKNLQMNEKNIFLQEFRQFSNPTQAISEAVKALLEGKIGGIKDIGGYHFAFSPFQVEAARRLREFKNRDRKPFAVMFLNLEEVRKYCEVSEKEAALLESSARPIVLLKKKCEVETSDFVYEVCGESDRIGALLPCNPLQILLLEETGPLVMTSGNRGGEPIIISEEEMCQHIGNGIDFLLTHNREILTPLDDSIYQVAETGQVQMIRRARGLVPEPITLKRKLAKDTFAAGGDLKATFAYGREELVYLSQYFGDLEDVRCMESRKAGIERMEQLLDIYPEILVGDMHPGYFSTREINEFSKITGGVKIENEPEASQQVQKKVNYVQHHHAHIASVIAEHGLEGKVLGVACDGTGFGTDGTIWGSECLLCKENKMERLGHLMPVKLVGGDASAKQADMTLYSYMLDARERELCVGSFFEEKGNQMLDMAWKQNINTVYSSSMGRLFDAAAALLEICPGNSYEGECAIQLEQMAHKGRAPLSSCTAQEKGKINALKLDVKKIEGRYQGDCVKLLADLYNLKQRMGKDEICVSMEEIQAMLAYEFHHAIAEGLAEIALKICEENEVTQVALSGGTFINRILFKEVVQRLEKEGKNVYSNRTVPCGDGGIALGQIYLMTW